MEKARKGIALICIFSTLLMGCYSSAVIAPAEKERVHAGSIEYVVTKDGKKYVFEEPPAVANDTIVGRYAQSWWKWGQVSIPLSDVAEVSVSEYDPQRTLWACVGVVVVLGVTAGIVYVSYENAMAHLFD
jgi:hypothetical protein